MKLANIVTVSMPKIYFNITLSSTSKCAIWILCLFAGTGWRNGVQSRAKTSLSACVAVSLGEQVAPHFAGSWYLQRSGNDSFKTPEYLYLQQYLILTGLEFSLCLTE